MRRALLLGLAAATSLTITAAAGCRGGASDAPEASTASGAAATGASTIAGVPDPCALLPPDAIATVLGEPAPEPVTAVEPAPPLNLRQCEWSVEPSDASLRAVYLSVQTTDGFRIGGAAGGEYTAPDQFVATRAGYVTAVDVAGLGDHAFFATPDMGELQVLAGDTMLGLMAQQVGSDAQPVTGDQLRALMEAALSNL